MAYTFYLFIPEGLYYTISGYSSGYGKGDSTACATLTNVSESTTLSISFGLASGYTFSRWVINEGGSSVRYAYTQTLSYTNTSGKTPVYVRAEVSIAVSTTYYATLAFNANGGSGAPSSVSGSVTNTTGDTAIALTIPYTIPTRPGYTFLYWQLTLANGTVVYYSPGGTANVQGSASGVTYTLYAVWQESGGGVHIYSGGWRTATPYICVNGTWRKSTPYICVNGTWRKAT